MTSIIIFKANYRLRPTEWNKRVALQLNAKVESGCIGQMHVYGMLLFGSPADVFGKACNGCRLSLLCAWELTRT